MSTWGNLSNDTGGLSYNLAASLSGNDQAPNQSPLGAEQFPVLGQMAQPNQTLRQQLQSLSQSQSQPQPQLQSQLQERPASAAAAAASILLNTLQQNGNTASSNGDANKDLNTNGNASSSRISSVNIPPPGLEAQQPLSQEQQQQQPESQDYKELAEEDKTDMDRYGLDGLLDLLRNGSSDQNSVSVGTDLNMLGLDMTQASVDKKISKTFASPWLETSRSEVTPLFKKPESFNVDTKDLANLEALLPSFTDENLFFIFYSKPRDILQDLVTKELNNRSWRFHKDLQVWVTKDNSGEVTATVPGGEQRSYIFFDPTSWKYVTKEFMLYYSSLL